VYNDLLAFTTTLAASDPMVAVDSYRLWQ